MSTDAELRALAEAVIAEGRSLPDGGVSWFSAPDLTDDAGPFVYEEAAFIAAANPSTVLALLDRVALVGAINRADAGRIERLEAEKEALAEAAESYAAAVQRDCAKTPPLHEQTCDCDAHRIVRAATDDLLALVHRVTDD